MASFCVYNWICDSSYESLSSSFSCPSWQPSLIAQTYNQIRILNKEKSDTVPPFLSSTKPPLGVCGVVRGGSAVNYPSSAALTAFLVRD